MYAWPVICWASFWNFVRGSCRSSLWGYQFLQIETLQSSDWGYCCSVLRPEGLALHCADFHLILWCQGSSPLLRPPVSLVSASPVCLGSNLLYGINVLAAAGVGEGQSSGFMARLVDLGALMQTSQFLYLIQSLSSNAEAPNGPSSRARLGPAMWICCFLTVSSLCQQLGFSFSFLIKPGPTIHLLSIILNVMSLFLYHFLVCVYNFF